MTFISSIAFCIKFTNNLQIQWDFDYIHPGKLFAINTNTWTNFIDAIYEIAKVSWATGKNKELLYQFAHLSRETSNTLNAENNQFSI